MKIVPYVCEITQLGHVVLSGVLSHLQQKTRDVHIQINAIRIIHEKSIIECQLLLQDFWRAFPTSEGAEYINGVQGLNSRQSNLPSRGSRFQTAEAPFDTHCSGIDLPSIHCLRASQMLQGNRGDNETLSGVIDSGEIDRIGRLVVRVR